MNLSFTNSIAAMLPELVELRRDLHRHPELLFDLPRTARLVGERLWASLFRVQIRSEASCMCVSCSL